MVDNNASSQLARVAVKPPPFCRQDPSLWFIQLDAQFKLSHITADETQFYTAIAALESEVLKSVREIILSPPATEKYKSLKEKLISVYAESETVKIKQLLQDFQLGDMRPSQLLSKMSDLSAGNLTSNILKTLWMNRLPSNMQAILAASSEPLTKLSEIADKIHEVVMPTQIHAVQTPDQGIVALQAQINELSKQVSQLVAIQAEPFQRHRSTTRGRYARRSTSRKRYESPPPGICFYHHNFGDKANKCRQPCRYNNQGNETGRR
ncbi:uncharacterized protein [Parasteatoda tepidariorum]|uniref:uncharacterized protein n=1 Tax=Parasteatoda tepidariorum TaxID=114398 RepID=UPI001C7288D3|nr:uncharacterized protein LOC122270644 [Parasteatoda tepidariorum]